MTRTIDCVLCGIH